MFFFLLFVYPALEILAFYFVGKAFGNWYSPIFLTLATSFIGASLLKTRRGGASLNDEYSARSIENFLCGNLGCFLLILPGFITDVLGIMFLIPFARRFLLKVSSFCGFNFMRVSPGAFSVFQAYSFRDAFQSRSSSEQYENVVDVEAEPAQRSGVTTGSADDEPIDVEYTIRNER
ncbi:MAG: FxsA family protein [Thermoguttaceae bacterium]|nr:FxsA family protein [Thermoguttaceae bacterium]